MDSFILGEDIHVAYITADGFPEGITDAHRQLHTLFSDVQDRRTFGISSPNINGIIIYKAAVEATPEEAEHRQLNTFTIRHGSYMSFYIADFRNDIESISRAFELLTGQQEADPDGYCLEWYIGENDVKCLVPSGPEEYPAPHL